MYESAIVIGPALMPLVVDPMVIFSLIVCAFVLIILAVPSDGPPSATASAIFAAVIASSAISVVPMVVSPFKSSAMFFELLAIRVDTSP